jgi:serine/threonine protein kinase
LKITFPAITIAILVESFILEHIFILGKSLGKGTFGKVKLATHTLTGEKVIFNNFNYHLKK